MIEIDGSRKSGSGTILRLSVALSSILGQPLHIYNIRQNRPQPGLRPQHLEAVLTAAKLCEAKVEGAVLNSRELWFKPKRVIGGKFEAEIGTAGSIPMLIMTVLPICIFAENTVQLHVLKGGTDVSHSPTINYMRQVFLPVLKRMGINANITVHKYGYYPKGMGEATLTVEPCKELKPLHMEEFGTLKAIKGISVCTFLADRRVAERQATAANNYLRERGLAAQIQTLNDRSNPLQKGSSIVLWAETEKGALLGADAIGELRKTSETVGVEAAEKLYAEISSRATVDVHLADMLIPYVALARGRSAYLARALSDHLETNIWLAETLLGVKFKVEKVNGLYKIEKVD
ncbi:MAG: RNA 3'-terminal phosphate cyclase [Candidatus Bathyarchaeota archaeon]|nr:RNA 3'-terminal phosphate cyclase [Candidatus Bathyarchaeota archaeon A05DMB-3]MDH7606175.1 RNA 3'-terminal phosphate cyclase [Candidatus Bathyarchaeota archaeon]